MNGVFDLPDYWHDLMTAHTRARDAGEIGKTLLANRNERGRYCHNLEHLQNLLVHVDELASYAADLDAVRMAAWYVDSVCEGRPDDALNSAARAEIELWSLGLPAALVAEVKRLVRLTMTHDPPRGDRNGEMLCDADLAVFAAPPGQYRRYMASMRAELINIADDVFSAARQRDLRSLLDRPNVYHTPLGHHRWEAAARANLQAEFDLLIREPEVRADGVTCCRDD